MIWDLQKHLHDRADARAWRWRLEGFVSKQKKLLKISKKLGTSDQFSDILNINRSEIRRHLMLSKMTPGLQSWIEILFGFRGWMENWRFERFPQTWNPEVKFFDSLFWTPGIRSIERKMPKADTRDSARIFFNPPETIETIRQFYCERFVLKLRIIRQTSRFKKWRFNDRICRIWSPFIRFKK